MGRTSTPRETTWRWGAASVGGAYLHHDARPQRGRGRTQASRLTGPTGVSCPPRRAFGELAAVSSSRGKKGFVRCPSFIRGALGVPIAIGLGLEPHLGSSRSQSDARLWRVFRELNVPDGASSRLSRRRVTTDRIRARIPSPRRGVSSRHRGDLRRADFRGGVRLYVYKGS